MMFYYSTKKCFIDLVGSGVNEFIKKMQNGAAECGGYNIGDQELSSWKSNAEALVRLLQQSNLSDDVCIGFEYVIPVGGRIDCVLFGHDNKGGKNMVHIELKQWSNDNVQPYYSAYGVVVGGGSGGVERIESHPSAQANEYQNHLLNHIIAFENENIALHGFAYCYNYKAKKDNNFLHNKNFDAVMKQCPLYCGDQISDFAKVLNELLCGGKGDEVCNKIINSEIRPTKRLQDAAKNMFDGKCATEEFSLIGNQLKAYNNILNAIENSDKENQKTVVIVKGGPGTGKSVIAMRLVSGLAKNGFNNVCYSTRSTSLLNGYKSILQGVSYKDGNDCSAIDLLIKNARVKPNLQCKENYIDALVVDEAHRIENAANDYNDRDKSKKTHLSQIMAMLCVSKVSVFFIDDCQAIKPIEIGTADEIKNAAINYNCRIKKENDDFKKVIENYPSKIERANDSLKNASCLGDYRKKRHAEKRLRTLEGDYKNAKDWLEAAKTNNPEIKVIEFELIDQFRCNGSNNYLKWIDDVLYGGYKSMTANLNHINYDFQLFDNPNDLYAKIKSLDDYAIFADKYKTEHGDVFSYKQLKKESEGMHFEQRARLLAGWCWDWKDSQHGGELQENGDLPYEVTIDAFHFAMPWETKLTPRGDFLYKYAKNADMWLNQNEGVNQIGCVHSAQGWEIDYVGVIIGPDVKYDKENDCLRYNENGNNHNIGHQYSERNDRLIKNTYRVLLTRGKKGCFVFACDPEVRDYIRKCMG